MTVEILQPLLGLDRLNPLFEILFKPDIPDELLVHFGMKFLEKVRRNSLHEKLLIARFFNAGFNQDKLSEAFEYDRKTMRRWGNLLKSGEPEDINKIGEGQGAPKKITDDRLQYIFYLFDKHYEEQGCHIGTFIVNEYFEVYHEKISHEAIRLKLVERKKEFKEKRIEVSYIPNGKDIICDSKSRYPVILYSEELKERNRFSYLIGNIMSKKAFDLAEDGENTCGNDIISASVFEKKSKYSPQRPISAGKNFPIVDTVSSRVFSCHHIGILLSRIFLDFISENLDDISNIVRQWIAMILSGCQNIEQGQGLNYRALELFIGEQKTSANKQRDRLKEIADFENINLLFKQNIRMIKAEYDDTFLLDPHGVPYTGQLPTLKCWLGSSHSVGKGYYLDLIHTIRGEPVFSIIDDNYYDLRQRFLADIRKFKEILGGDKNRILTMVVDRAIYDVEFMKLARTKDIHIITWEKNYKRGLWNSNFNCSVKTFFIMKYRNKKEDTYTYTVQYFRQQWEKEKTFAQFIILLSKPKQQPIELSVICTDFGKNPEEAIRFILTRWLQENDIGYLILLGINQITSYSHYSYEDTAKTLADRNIKNKKYTRLTAQRIKLKKDLGILLVDRELYIEKKEQSLAAMEEEKLSHEKQINKKNISSIQAAIIGKKLKAVKTKIRRLPGDKEKVLNRNLTKQNELRKQIKEINEKLMGIPREVSRIELLIKEEYVKLNFMPKTFMDAIKITTRNIIYQLLEIFRPIWNNYRNDLVILRELISSMGHIEETKKSIIIQLNPARQFSKNEKYKILLFLFKISCEINKKYDLEKTIILSLYEP
jgi:hypothetical protein